MTNDVGGSAVRLNSRHGAVGIQHGGGPSLPRVAKMRLSVPFPSRGCPYMPVAASQRL